MMRVLYTLAICAALAGCSAHGSGSGNENYARDKNAPMAAPPPLGGERREANFAYTHNLTLDMPDASVLARYERGRKLCLEDATLNCSLLNSSVRKGSETGLDHDSANFTVRLPHEKIAAFETALLAPVEGEKPGDARVSGQETQAEDLSAPVADNESRTAQLKDYLQRLTLLTQRPDIKVEELVQVERELSQTQSQIEEIAAQQRAMRDRIDRDTLSVSLETRPSGHEDLTYAWRNALDGLGENAVAVVGFVLAALPWLPIGVIGFVFLGLGWRLIRAVQGGKGRKAAVKSA